MRRFKKTFLDFILSVLVAAVLANLFSTQFVIAALENAGAKISWGERLNMNVYDLVHLGPIYAVFIFIGLAIAFYVAHKIHGLAKIRRPLVYVAAGMTCFAVMLYLMQSVFFDVPLISGARSTMGWTFQVIAGGLAGYVFARLTPQKTE